MTIKMVSLGELIGLLYESGDEEFQISLPDSKLLVIKVSASINDLKVSETIPINDSVEPVHEMKPKKSFITGDSKLLQEQVFKDDRSSKGKRQVLKAIDYARNHNIKFSHAVKKLFGRYAGNWDYEMAARLGYPGLKEKKFIKLVESKDMKSAFVIRRTRLLSEMGWDREDAERAAINSWDDGDRDPDNFIKGNPVPPNRRS
jgi:hypothetical protein